MSALIPVPDLHTFPTTTQGSMASLVSRLNANRFRNDAAENYRESSVNERSCVTENL